METNFEEIHDVNALTDRNEILEARMRCKNIHEKSELSFKK